MWPFNRKAEDTETDTVPEEIKDYYQAEKRGRMWTTWLLSAATFVVTVLVVVGLFWAGRWTYNRVTNGTDQPQPEVTVTQEPAQEPDQKPSDEPQSQPPADQPAEQPEQPGQSAAAPAPEPTPQITPQTGPTAELPRTGPTSDE